MKLTKTTSLLMFVCLCCAASNLSAQTLGTVFTYQGKLTDNGQAADGEYDLGFRVFTAANQGGVQIGPTLEFLDHPVVDGIFTVELDFTPAVFNTNTTPGIRWLHTYVNNTPLTPRQPLTGSPYSIQTRGLAVVEDGGGMRVGVGDVINNFADAFGVFADTTGFDGMTVETATGGNPTYAYKSGNNQSVYHHLDYDAQAWRLYNGGERIYVDSTGFVGVNKDTKVASSEDFGVYAPTSGFGGIMMETDAGGEPYYGYAADGQLKAYTYWDDDTNKFILRMNGIDVLTALNNGNVGIGYSTPGLKFQVNGECGKPGGGSWTNLSDRRLKKNIKELEGSLEKLMKLRGVNFEYLEPKKIGELEGERIGVIAQEVEKVFPDWVAQRDNGYKHVTFRGFEALTVEALRELRDEKDKQVEVLESENDGLRNENVELRDRMNGLELQMQELMASLESK